MKYVDASAVLRVVFREPGPAVGLSKGERLVSSRLVEIETFQAIDRARLLGHLDDIQTAVKRKELTDLIARLDLAAIDDEVIAAARSPFAVTLRALDAIHVVTAEILAAESGEPLEFWTHDDRQATAALSRGLHVRGLTEKGSGGGHPQS